MELRGKSLAEVVAAHAARPGADSALILLGMVPERHGYDRLWERARRIAGGLQREGIGRGDRVAMFMATSFDVSAAVVALSALGAVLVPLQPLGAGSGGSVGALRIATAIEIARPAACLVSGKDRQPLAALDVDAGAILDLQSLDAEPSAFADAADADPAILQFSSGSTGDPKGILLSRANIATNLEGSVRRLGWCAEDVALSWLPLYHDFGLISSLMCALWAGSTLILYSPSQFIRNPLGWLRLASEHRATLMCAPQFAYSICAAKLEIDPLVLGSADLSSVRWMFNGSEFVHWETCVKLERQLSRYGLRPNTVQPGYGLAENCAAVAVREPLAPVRTLRLPRAASDIFGGGEASDEVVLAGNGPAIEGTEIAALEADGTVLGEGRIGEICIRGSSATLEFVTRKGRSAAARHGGWVPTGDIGLIVDGELYIIGRHKEIIKKGGRTIAPPDVETSLELELGLEPGSTAVFGYYDMERVTEVALAVFELPRQRLVHCPPEFGQHARRHVARTFQMQLDQVYVARRGSLPRTSSGKIRRALMSQLAADGRLAAALRSRAEEDIKLF